MRNLPASARRDGAVLPLVTVCLVALLGFVALAIDVGMMAVARTQAQAAADRPRDIAISLDFSGSMKFSSEFNYPPNPGNGGPAITGGLNPDPTFPRFGPWMVYPVATSGNPNPMQRVDAYIDSGGETHAV